MSEPKRYYPNPGHAGFYTVERDSDGWRWYWQEGDVMDQSRPMSTQAEAFLDAAEDWDENGNSGDRRFSGMLQGLATRSAARASRNSKENDNA